MYNTLTIVINRLLIRFYVRTSEIEVILFELWWVMLWGIPFGHQLYRYIQTVWCTVTDSYLARNWDSRFYPLYRYPSITIWDCLQCCPFEAAPPRNERLHERRTSTFSNNVRYSKYFFSSFRSSSSVASCLKNNYNLRNYVVIISFCIF